MGAPLPEMEPVDNASAEALLGSLESLGPGERRKHASVFNYWLSIRGPRQFPPIRDLDPLEIADAGPWSILLEMIGGGEDAVLRHLGQAIKEGVEVENIADAPNPSLLACIHARLPLVASSREAMAFEDSFEAADGPRRCWVTLLPFSATGTWIDYVYGYVSLECGADSEVAGEPAQADEAEKAEVAELAAEEPTEDLAELAWKEPQPAEDCDPFDAQLRPYDEDAGASAIPEPEAVAEVEPEQEAAPEAADYEPEAVDAVAEPEPEAEPVPETVAEPEAGQGRPSFSSKLVEGLASSLYGKVTQDGSPHDMDDAGEPAEESADETAIEPVTQPVNSVEGSLQSKLSEVRALAEEAREAQIRSNIALYEGLSAAYDFALDAEDAPEEYLRLVEGQGLKIQLRSPMKPVVKLAFEGMCDEPTIKQLEAVLAWALKHDLPRGTLAERIQAEGGLGPILNGNAG